MLSLNGRKVFNARDVGRCDDQQMARHHRGTIHENGASVRGAHKERIGGVPAKIARHDAQNRSWRGNLRI
jgi:hypothetical protein